MPSDAFDCLVITQTLHLIYDLQAAVANLHRILAPGGTLLTTVPGHHPAEQRQVGRDLVLGADAAGRDAGCSAMRSGRTTSEVTAHGNVLTSVAFLEGLAARELRREELEVHDPQFPMLITVKATRPRSDLTSPVGVHAVRPRNGTVQHAGHGRDAL